LATFLDREKMILVISFQISNNKIGESQFF